MIVDDIVRTGRTLNALIELVNSAGARLVGVSVLISMSKSWIDKLRDRNVRVDVILDLSDLRS
ncbi:phosphoribosyltransferase family protein [Vulcanisaeta distributa]|uniref:phosphoribosyltransferase family protein n=1 Tax=Vulcanisaeta distributa TaxID=164451 RepID=UPI000A8057FA|nr:phosphoribosyltransferase family protein [Vulcanisaeta distributa]